MIPKNTMPGEEKLQFLAPSRLDWHFIFWVHKHIYENHLEMSHEQLKREPLPAPRLVIADRVPDYAKTGKYEPKWLEKIEPADFMLESYQHHAPLTAPMTV